jgi:hypothetical protein
VYIRAPSIYGIDHKGLDLTRLALGWKAEELRHKTGEPLNPPSYHPSHIIHVYGADTQLYALLE